MANSQGVGHNLHRIVASCLPGPGIRRPALLLANALIPLLTAPAAALAAGATAATGQAAAQGPSGPSSQDCLTIIIWTIAALSIAEMIRSSIQGLFTRLSGLNAAGFATRAAGAIAGVGALSGLANLGRAIAGGRGGAGGTPGGYGGGGINLAGEAAPEGGASPGAFTGASDPGGETGRPTGAGCQPAGSLMSAYRMGGSWGTALGSLAGGAATAIVGGALSMAGAAIPGGANLAEAGTDLFRNTGGRAIGYAGTAAGRFAGTHAGLLTQSLAAQRQSGGRVGISEAFRMVAGGATVGEAVSRSMRFAVSQTFHPQAGPMALAGQAEDAAGTSVANRPTSSMDGVRYSGADFEL